MDRRSPVLTSLVGLALVASIGALDYLTGYELSFSIFYLLPVSLVTWFTWRWLGFFFCGVSAFVWLIADYTSGHVYSQDFIAIWNTGVRLGFFLITSYLLSELKSHLKHEQTLATVDDLTEVLNARAFKDVARRLFELAERYHHSITLAYIDVDNFKSVNDSLGHSEGDRVLHAVANTLTKSIRAADVVGRLGGDEFAVLLPETDYAGAEKLFDRIYQELVQVGTRGRWPIGFSVGVAVFPTVPSSIDEALKIADRLMYQAKHGGKKYVIYEEHAGFRQDAEQPVPADGAAPGR